MNGRAHALPLLLVGVVALLTLGLVTPAHAVDCVPAPLPTTPLPPVYGMDVQYYADKFHIDLWRQPCQGGGESLLIRLTPITTAPFVCYVDFHLVQAGMQYTVTLRTSFSSSAPIFCDYLFVPTTVVPVPGPGAPPFAVGPAFQLLYSGYDASFQPVLFTLNVSAEGSAPPAPPSLIIVATGCTTCHAGDPIVFEARVTNPGPPIVVEFKAGVRMPDGTPVNLLGLFLERTFSTGTTVVPIVSGTMPTGVAAGAYTVEAALLEPNLGVTISRASAPVQVAP